MFHPDDQRKMEVRLEIHKDKTLAEATSIVHKVCVCMRVSMYACLYVCVSLCMRVSVYACLCVCVSLCMRVSVYVCLYVCVSLCTRACTCRMLQEDMLT